MDLSGTFDSLVEKLEGWLEGLILLLPNFVAAVLIVIAFAVAAKVARRVVRGVLGRTSSVAQVNSLLATVAYVVVLAAGIFVALGVLELDKTVTSLLAGAGIIGLALGFAFQDLASNFIAGILLAVRRPFTEGDIIETSDYFGTVEEVNLRSTWVRTFQGQRAIIPNSEVFQSPVVNYSMGHRRVDVRCGVAYGDDLVRAREVALEAVRTLDGIDPTRPVGFFYEEFGDSSINFVVNFWIAFHKQTDFLTAQSEAIVALKRALDEAGLTIPFPIRTLDFGVVGGERLDEVLPQRFYEGDGQRSAPPEAPPQ